jgi:hypothetical protein
MSVGFFNSWRRAGTVLFLLSVAALGTLRAAEEPRPRGRPIEFSDLNGGASSTNTITLGSPSLRRVDPLEGLTRQSSLDFRSSRPVPLPPPSSGVIIPNKRNNQSDDWASPDEVINNYVMEKIVGIPKYLSDDSQLAPFSYRGDRGFLSRNRGQTNSPAWKGFSFADPEGATDDRRDGESERGSRRAISSDGTTASTKFLFGGGSGGYGSPTRGPESFAERMGYNRRVDTTADELRERKVREEQLDAFKKNLSFQPSAPAASFNPFAVAPAPGSTPLTGSGGLAPQTSFSPLPGSVNPTFISGVPTAPTAPGAPSVPGLPGYLPPELAPNRLSRPEPVVVLPRRQF